MTLWRDPWGVPRVRGRDLAEAARLQGFVTAQDRTWQLEVERVRAQGLAAQVFGDEPGSAGRLWDDFVGHVDLPGWAQRAHARLSGTTRDFLAAYVEGVRDGLEAADAAMASGDLAVPEFDLLGRPRRTWAGEWEPWTPLAVFAVQQVLFSQFPSDLWARHVSRLLDPEVAADLVGRVHAPDGARGGSNAFAVGAGLTASGAPLIGGDPHRLLEFPGVYQQIGIATPDFDVVGLTFVGVPGVQHFGQAETVAWAVTNAMADAVDVVEEPGREHRDGLGFELRTPAGASGDLGFEALVPLLHARTVDDVDAALEHWVEPVNDVLVADASGRVLHRVAGRVPERECQGEAWQGWAPLPRREAMPHEIAVSANDRTRPDYDRLHPTGGAARFAPPARRDRIATLLRQRAAAGPVTREDLLDVLGDERENTAEALVQRVARVQPATEAGVALQTRLLAWDRVMAAGSTTASAYVAIREAVVDALVHGPALAPVVGTPDPYTPLLSPWFELAARVCGVLPDLLADGSRQRWGVDLDEAVEVALDEVGRRWLAAELPAWGDRHRFAPVHALADFGLDPRSALPDFFGTPLGGDTESVAVTASFPGSSWVVRGSCVRYLFDVGDPSRSRWAVPGGSHGSVLHPHHGDQFEAWRTGELLPARPFALRDVAMPQDAALVHRWVEAPGAEFWGMRGVGTERVAEIYGWIAEQPHLTARIISFDGHPLGLFQTYDPFVDEIGAYYDRRSGDLGVHLLLADDPVRSGLTSSLLDFLCAEAFADPAVQRLVLEPDVKNARSVARFARLGAEWGDVVDMVLPTGSKQARFAFVPRSSQALQQARATVASRTKPGSSSRSP